MYLAVLLYNLTLHNTGVSAYVIRAIRQQHYCARSWRSMIHGQVHSTPLSKPQWAGGFHFEKPVSLKQF